MVKDNVSEEQSAEKSPSAACGANVITFRPIEKPPSCTVDEGRGDEEELDAVDMTQSRNQAHAIRGALSTIELIDIDPRHFWLAFTSDAERKLTIEWVRKSVRTLQAIEEEHDRAVSSEAIGLKAERLHGGGGAGGHT